MAFGPTISRGRGYHKFWTSIFQFALTYEYVVGFGWVPFGELGGQLAKEEEEEEEEEDRRQKIEDSR